MLIHFSWSVEWALLSSLWKSLASHGWHIVSMLSASQSSVLLVRWSMFGYHPADKVCFLSVAHFACLLWFPGGPIWRCLKNLFIQPRHDCMSSLFVAYFLLKYYWKLVNSFKHKMDEKRIVIQVQISKILVRTAKGKCRNTNTYYDCTFSQGTFSMRRPASFRPLKFTGLESFSPTEACMTCLLSCRCDLSWNEETCSVFSPAASCVVKPIESCGGSSGMLFLWQPSANTSY